MEAWCELFVGSYTENHFVAVTSLRQNRSGECIMGYDTESSALRLRAPSTARVAARDAVRPRIASFGTRLA